MYCLLKKNNKITKHLKEKMLQIKNKEKYTPW